jgi:hypothetical protein
MDHGNCDAAVSNLENQVVIANWCIPAGLSFYTVFTDVVAFILSRKIRVPKAPVRGLGPHSPCLYIGRFLPTNLQLIRASKQHSSFATHLRPGWGRLANGWWRLRELHCANHHYMQLVRCGDLPTDVLEWEWVCGRYTFRIYAILRRAELLLLFW